MTQQKRPMTDLERLASASSQISRRRMMKIGGMGAAGVVLGGGVLAACGDDDDDTAGGATDTTAAATDTTAAATSPATSGSALDAVQAHWVYIGPPDDNGWTQTHDDGRKAAETGLAGKAVTGFTPNVGFGAETTQVFRDLAAAGNNLIVANTEYVDLMHVVAAENTDVKFLECNGHVFTENLGAYYMAHEIPAYLLGVAAGLLAPSGKIGYIGAFPSSTGYNDANGLLLGARSVNPEATVNVVLVSTFFDPVKAAQAAEALLADGVEFLFGVMDEPTFLQIAEEAGVWTGYWNLDFRSAAPTKYVNNFDLSAWGPYYTQQLQAVLDGTWTAGTEATLLECPLGAWGDEVPQDVQDAVAEAKTALDAAGGVYVGPIFDNKGEERIPAGEVWTSQQAYAVNFAVDGVTGLD